ncbi:hypothetical protein I8751_07770 [Nostocaceae cyanobacterium CENA357]|uniref:Uncharacterized protein n=1 Tax=Atlanticothrix silvestris CENA357 TaxID=1725252 RepID=A0A8J7HA75_9CYAN|nr:hypothetical protein [Atlanticothrix silvestris]MBH8552271.1 hypothetical protein [Atlanticothrix silvestris CENA357]
MSKKSSFIQILLQPWQALTVLMVVSVLVLGLGGGKLMPTNLLGIQSALAQRVSPGDVWQQVYQQFPDLPKENQYNSKDSGKIAANNTLASRLIRYHIYVKGRSPNYRLDWKLTLADYLGVNEIMYDSTYPGNDTLKQNPIAGDRIAIKNLTRQQRNALVQVLANLFNPGSQNTQVPNPNRSAPPQQPQQGGADLLR